MKTAALVIAFLIIAYLGVCGAAWKVRNPIGNDWTFWMYFPAPLTFDRIPELQIQVKP